MGFQCYYCDGKTKQFNAIIQHLILKHPANEMKIRKIMNVNGTIKLITTNFSSIIPNEIEVSGKKIVIQDSDSMTISITKYTDDHHISKCSKLENDCDSAMKCNTMDNKIENEFENKITNEMNDILNLKSNDTENSSMQMEDNDSLKIKEENIDDLISEFTSMIPDVIQRLSDDGSAGTIVKFFNLIRSDIFPLNNIAFIMVHPHAH